MATRHGDVSSKSWNVFGKCQTKKSSVRHLECDKTVKGVQISSCRNSVNGISTTETFRSSPMASNHQRWTKPRFRSRNLQIPPLNSMMKRWLTCWNRLLVSRGIVPSDCYDNFFFTFLFLPAAVNSWHNVTIHHYVKAQKVKEETEEDTSHVVDRWDPDNYWQKQSGWLASLMLVVEGSDQAFWGAVELWCSVLACVQATCYFYSCMWCPAFILHPSSQRCSDNGLIVLSSKKCPFRRPDCWWCLLSAHKGTCWLNSHFSWLYRKGCLSLFCLIKSDIA